MKELSIQEKASRYDEAIEQLRAMMPNWERLSYTGKTFLQDLIYILPELQENEDERIRKEIIRIVDIWTNSSPVVNGIPRETLLAWLEKKGEEKKITHEEICKSYGISDIGEFSDGYHTFNGLYKQRMFLFAVLVKTYKDRAWKSWKHEDGLDCFGGGWFIVGIDTPDGTYTYHYEAKDWDRFDCQILEKAKHWDGHDESDVERLFSLVSNTNKREEKVDNANKLERKFKIGDWVYDKGSGKTYLIKEIDNNGYLVYCQRTGETKYLGLSEECVNYYFRRWDIQDAEDGDVLCTYECDEPKIVFILKGTPKKHCALNYRCYYNIMYPHFETDSKKGCLAPNDEDVKPATKEQRETLFKAMHEAGYEWDAGKKELNKIEQNHIPKYEDLTKLKSAIALLEHPAVIDENGEIREKTIDFLKSLKERVGCAIHFTTTREWSEEDRDYYDAIIAKLEVTQDDASLTDNQMEFLKSLKERYAWKPSDEQINALDNARHSNPFNVHILDTLFHELKKL